jgi:hypothetical protein
MKIILTHPPGEYSLQCPPLYRMFFLSLSSAPQLSRQFPADVGFQCDKAAVLEVRIKMTLCTIHHKKALDKIKITLHDAYNKKYIMHNKKQRGNCQ